MTTTSKNGLVHIVFHKHEAYGNTKTENNVSIFTTSTVKKKQKKSSKNTFSVNGFPKKKKQQKYNETSSYEDTNNDDYYEKPQPYTQPLLTAPKSRRNSGKLSPVSTRSSGFSNFPQIATRHYKLMPVSTCSSGISTSPDNKSLFLDEAEFTPASARDLESTCVKIKRSQQAAEMASRMINIKIASEANSPTLSSKFPAFHSSTGVAGTGIDYERRQLIQVSSATLARVERVKASIELHYDMIAAYQGSNMCVVLSDSKNKNCSVETDNRGEYNPLRIIRNRRTRDLLKLPNTQTQAIQLAEQQMQSRHLYYAKSLWTIDAFEMVMDCAWSQQLIQLQKQGKSILQIENNEENKHSNTAIEHQRKPSVILDPLDKVTSKISSRSFEPSIAEAGFDQGEQQNLQQTFKKNDRRKSKSSSMLLDLINPTSLRTEKGNFSGQRSVSSSTISLPTQPITQIKSIAKSGYIDNNGKDSNQVSDNNQTLISSSLCSNEKLHFCDNSMSATPFITGDSTWISPHSSMTESSQLSLMRKTCTQRLEEYKLYETIYITQHQHNQQQLNRVGPAVRGSTENVRANCLYADISKTLSYTHRTILPKANAMQQMHETQVQLLRRTRLSKLSTRIDMLLADCDQTNNRLSTTINLELKTLTEKIDALDRHVTIKKHIKWCMCTTMYCLLEYVVVSIMWIAWGLMAALMTGKDSVLIVTKAIRWLLWC